MDGPNIYLYSEAASEIKRWGGVRCRARKTGLNHPSHHPLHLPSSFSRPFQGGPFTAVLSCLYYYFLLVLFDSLLKIIFINVLPLSFISILILDMNICYGMTILVTLKIESRR